MRYWFRVKDRSRRASHDMLQMMAKHGNHYHTFTSDADVKRFFAEYGYDYADVVQKCRKVDQAVPLVENLIQSTWTASEGVTMAIVNGQTGQEMTEVEGPGTLVSLQYWGRFEDAVRDLRHCLERASVGAFQSCVSSGIAGIEAYIAHRASLHNSRHPTEQLRDSKQRKVPLEAKIDDWIPKMSGGRRFNKGGQNWEHFKILQSFRDQVAIHPKDSSLAIDHGHLCRLLNMFRSGIAGLLVDLHLLFRERIPCIIVRYAYLGPIELVREEG